MSWNQLLALIKQSREVEDEYRKTKPVCCPNDAHTLVVDTKGRLFCPWDGWNEDMGVGEHR